MTPTENRLSTIKYPLILAASLVLLPSAQAHAQAPSRSARLAEFNPQFIDVGSIGVRPGPEHATANRKLLYAAMSQPLVAPDGSKTLARVIRFPNTWPQKFVIDKPLRLPAYVKLWGIDREFSNLVCQGESWTVLVGLPTVPIDPKDGKPKPLSRDHWVDLSRLVPGKSGERYAWRSKADSFLALPASPFSLGPPGGYEALDHLVIETVLDIHEPAFKSGPICGIRDKQTAPQPWSIETDQGYFVVRVRTSDQKVRSFRFPSPKWPALIHLAIDIDLQAGKVVAVVNGTQTNVDLRSMGADFASGRLKFAPNELGTGVVGITTIDLAESALGTILDFTLGGLRLAFKRVYQDVGQGKPAVRKDGKAVARERVFDEGPDILWYLRNNDTLDDLVSTGIMATRPYNGSAIVLQPANAAVASSCADNAIKDMSIGGGYAVPSSDGTSTGYGGSVLLGPVFDFELNHVAMNAGGDALASLFPTGSYQTTITDCRFSSNHIPVCLWTHNAYINRVKITHSGPVCFVFRACGLVDLNGAFLSGFGPVRRVIDLIGDFDTNFYRLTSICCDFEGGPYPSECLVRCTGALGQQGTKLVANSIWLGITPPGIPLFDLRGQNLGPNWIPHPSTFDISGCCSQLGSPPIVRSDKTWWGKVQINGGEPATPIAIGEGASQVTIERLGIPPTAKQ
jgi:hypothetical protein